MKRLSSVFSLLVIISTIFFTGCNKDIPVEPDQMSTNTDTYIVALNLGADNSIQANLPVKDQIASFIASRGIALEKVSSIYDVVLTGFAAKLNRDQLDALQGDKAVRYIEKDRIWTLDFPFEITKRPGGGGSTPPPAQTTPWGISAVGGGGANVTTDVKVWIIDTGIDLDHGDLNVSPASPGGLSKTFVAYGKDSESPDDRNGHGSHVAGIIGARNDDYGVVGVAPGIKVVAVKVLNQQGSGTTTAILDGLDYVAHNANPGDVVNMSLGYNGTVTSVDEAVYNCSVNAEVYIAIAAGNESDDAIYHTPARIGKEITINGTTSQTYNIVAVSAHNSDYYFTSWSNFGSPVEWCAPGLSIFSCYKNGGYATMSGTSMAAPHVAGIMALNNGAIHINTSNGHDNGYVYDDPDETDDPLAHK